MIDAGRLRPLRTEFGDRVESDVNLAPYTAARIGGPAEVFLVLNSEVELETAVRAVWQAKVPCFVLGGGSNILISDRGVRGVTLLNRARKVTFRVEGDCPEVLAESGANFGVIARQAAAKGLAGLAWAAGIPGTVGGAVVGNAGAHGGDMAGVLNETHVLHLHQGRQTWSATDMRFAYRSSRLKSEPDTAVVLSARLALQMQPATAIQAQLADFLSHRRRTQPPGASMGSMFKNPQGDHAGRLVDDCGLKGHRIGDAGISELHGNFFLNHGQARSADVLSLIDLARETVVREYGIELELEIEKVGKHD